MRNHLSALVDIIELIVGNFENSLIHYILGRPAWRCALAIGAMATSGLGTGKGEPTGLRT